jgi:hypothetical protein
MAGGRRASRAAIRTNRELLSISLGVEAQEALRIINWWRATGDGSIPAKLKRHADRLLREFHRLDEVSLEILGEFDATGSAIASANKIQT